MSTLYTPQTSTQYFEKHDAKVGPQTARQNRGDLRRFAAAKGYAAKSFDGKLSLRPPNFSNSLN